MIELNSKNAFKTVTYSISFVLNAIKRAIPFTRVVIVADRNNWINVNRDAIIRELYFSRFILERAKFTVDENWASVAINRDFRSEKYKGINLYHVSEYNICVALREFPSKISFDNEEHRRIISEWFTNSSKCIDFYEKMIATKKPYKIMISQGHNFDSAVVRALSCVYGFKIVAVENTFNKNKIVWDDVSGITVNKNLAKNYFWKYRDVVEESVATSYVDEYLADIKHLKSAEHQTPVVSLTASDKKTVLFLGQVYSDSSILFGINDFACPVDIVEGLVDYCIESDYGLIIKLHPKEATKDDILGQPYNDLTFRKICQRSGLHEKIIDNGFILDKGSYDTYALIDLADVCVTVNSQAGLEALIKEKDLIVCGQSFYSGLGFTLEALNKDGLLCSLDQVLKRCVSVLDRREINKFFYITSEKYFLDLSEKSVQKLLVG